MTDLDRQLTVEERLAVLEARLSPTPLALVPPVTVGSLSNVPAPGSQIAAQWAQDVSARIVHRFATTAALKAWAAPADTFAVAGDTGIVWRRVTGGWSQVTPYTQAQTGVFVGTIGGTEVACGMTLPADPGPRVATVSLFLGLDRLPTSGHNVSLFVNGGVHAQANFVVSNIVATPSWYRENVTLIATDIAIPANTAVICQALVAGSPFTFQTQSTAQFNRLDALVLPRGH